MGYQRRVHGIVFDWTRLCLFLVYHTTSTQQTTPTQFIVPTYKVPDNKDTFNFAKNGPRRTTRWCAWQRWKIQEVHSRRWQALLQEPPTPRRRRKRNRREGSQCIII